MNRVLRLNADVEHDPAYCIVSFAIPTHEAIREIFRETERGEFARDWMQEWALGMPMLHRLRRTAASGAMEQTGAAWRREFGK